MKTTPTQQRHYVAEWRSFRLLKKVQLAAALNITPQAYQEKEKGNTAFKDTELIILAKLLKTTVDNLLLHPPSDFIV